MEIEKNKCEDSYGNRIYKEKANPNVAAFAPPQPQQKRTGPGYYTIAEPQK